MRDKNKFKNELLLSPLVMILYGGLYAIFFGLFGSLHFQMRNFSRTSGVTLLTFTVMLVVMVSVYGGYDIGKRKSKPVISSLLLATYITDLVTYIIFQIMNVNPNFYDHFVFFGRDFLYLLLIMALQFLLIVFMVRFGNHVYFMLNPPEKSCIITSTQEMADHMLEKIGTLKLQYAVESIYHYQYSRVKREIRRHDTVFFGDVPSTERASLLEYCYKNQKNVYFAAQLDDVMISHGSQVVLDDMSFIFMQRWEMSIFQRVLKRLMDIVLSVICLVVASPIMGVIALAILLDDGDPVIFSQKRLTQNGSIFKIYKFRTMTKEASFGNGKRPKSVVEGDDRITKVGAFLRKHRLDELPQLFNILKGDMSFVGPRPEMIENVVSYTKDLPSFNYRYKVKAGLTGYAQIEGKYNTTPQDKLMLDMMYIQNYSFFMDLKILMRTLMVFFRKDSAAAFIREKNGDDCLKMIRD